MAVVGGYCWLTLATLYPPLPTPSEPLFFYSNHIHSDLKRSFLRAIQKTKHSIFLQMYGLTDPGVLSLLSQKAAEGIEVKIFHDKTASHSLPAHLSPFSMKGSGLMHRKIFILDHHTVFLGTANCTTPSLKMHDNLVLGIHSEPLAHFLERSSEEIGTFALKEASLSLYLLPDFEGKALKALCLQLEQARTSIKIAMFTLTHPVIVQKLLAAIRRGVEVTVAIDRYTAKGASKKGISALKEGGANIWVSQGSQLFHHKWALIDDKTFLLGSANWTKAAFEKNQDFLLILEKLPEKSQKTLQKIWRAVAISSRKE